MPITIQYIEQPNSLRARLIVTNPDDPNNKDDFEIPKFMFDLVKAGVQNGSLNLTALWTRALNISKSL